ncbi:MAG: hypothetical protein ABEI52_07765 [Halobacteriaceae archaeon]
MNRLFPSEYDGDVGDPLMFRLFSVDRLRESSIGTGCSVEEVIYAHEESPDQWRAALAKD